MLKKNSVGRSDFFPHNFYLLCNLESYLCIIICVSSAYIDSFKTLSTAIDGIMPFTSLLVQ
jgi:hypothetical protein